jgi:hypothetical protein
VLIVVNTSTTQNHQQHTKTTTTKTNQLQGNCDVLHLEAACWPVHWDCKIRKARDERGKTNKRPNIVMPGAWFQGCGFFGGVAAVVCRCCLCNDAGSLLTLPLPLHNDPLLTTNTTNPSPQSLTKTTRPPPPQKYKTVPLVRRLGWYPPAPAPAGITLHLMLDGRTVDPAHWVRVFRTEQPRPNSDTPYTHTLVAATDVWSGLPQGSYPGGFRWLLTPGSGGGGKGLALNFLTWDDLVHRDEGQVCARVLCVCVRCCMRGQ